MNSTFPVILGAISAAGLSLAQSPAPPVGDHRWRAPQAAAPWDGVRQATKFGPSPIQGPGKDSGMSEDCLYLNVWTPAKTAKDHVPGLLWIYGGGTTSDASYSGEKLARKGVVLAGIACRAGQLGFFCMPLNGEETRAGTESFRAHGLCLADAENPRCGRPSRLQRHPGVVNWEWLD